MKEYTNSQRRSILKGAGAALATSSLPVWAQSGFPNKPIRLIVPFAPGGTTDIIARIVAEPLGRALGQTVIVENRAGGGGTIGAEAVKGAAPDGYTLKVATVSTMATNPAVNPKISYNPLTDFVPITNIAATPNVLAVHPSFPAKNYQEFIKQVRANPGKYTYASSGTGGVLHMMGELFKDSSKTFIIHIPYRGSGPALNDALAGQVNMIFDNLPSSLPHIQNSRLRGIAVAAPKRLLQLPDIPTFAEIGLPQVNEGAWYGLLAPRGTSADIVKTLYDATMRVLQQPDVRKRIQDTTSDIIGNTPQQFAAQIKETFERYQKLVRERKITLEG
ncbi:MAG: tripartite tricarboxylate transporter substrate binding protein BugE [Burkholderiales bacterium]|jgi:tripartite-type tricarboxylate transporter receptor subunit TctC|nr:tripartite tricarboxylate transporter substrate binding protein BugE [Burkholderiales bacterium]MCA3155613.1 tripartite tricarboxylate transporter substrate binding protein BugE [Burkholderiales bacterium]MCA3156954.1 tripartite tricarboxylate transporter substrate binding protein BugE [Burkholderiales bacterium]MCA3167183.1 tripartite tricarboxylate transporter substrate binding protein BugE [Burkholderiales bacterium]